MVGDSLVEQQQHQIIRNLLHSSTGPFELTTRATRPRVDSLWLKPEHEPTAHYLTLAGVTQERLLNPITTFVLERHLLSPAEYDRAFAHVDGYVPLASEEPYQWVSESIWKDELRKILANPVEESGDGVADEPMILLLSRTQYGSALDREGSLEEGCVGCELVTGLREHGQSRRSQECESKLTSRVRSTL